MLPSLSFLHSRTNSLLLSGSFFRYANSIDEADCFAVNLWLDFSSSLFLAFGLGNRVGVQNNYNHENSAGEVLRDHGEFSEFPICFRHISQLGLSLVLPLFLSCSKNEDFMSSVLPQAPNQVPTPSRNSVIIAFRMLEVEVIPVPRKFDFQELS